MKKFEELTFKDDFMFSKIMQDPEICKTVVELLLNIKIEKLEYFKTQESKKTNFFFARSSV